MTTITTDKATSQAAGVAQFASGNFTADSNAQSLSIGFKPRFFKLYDNTGVTTWEKVEGDLAANAWKTVGSGPTFTLDTNSYILFNSDNSTVSLSASILTSTHVYSWVAFG